ncbi:hypothetical protein V5799_029660 [Amblyomma americanum]|uniref:G protein-coupled receptor n=1 Tax=Amblyomma americanum TaxID=6943 RepID=A0AAQ4EQJ6_AMBAM
MRRKPFSSAAFSEKLASAVSWRTQLIVFVVLVTWPSWGASTVCYAKEVNGNVGKPLSGDSSWLPKKTPDNTVVGNGDSSELFPPRCPQTDSCKNRCGVTSDDEEYTCHCDQLCVKYGDCCVDVQKHCQVEALANPLSQRPPCVDDPDSPIDHSFFYVSKCPDGVDVDSEDEDDDVKVLGEDGIVYANGARARCNGATNAVPLALLDNSEAESSNHSTRLFARTCVRAVDTCKLQETVFGEWKLAHLCAAFQGPVRSFQRASRKRKLHKNAYCALCNGDVPDLRCPGGVKTYSQKEMASSLFQDTQEKSYEATDDIPSSFSIVLNFGLDGVEKYKFSSESKETMIRNQQLCPDGFIWDPFAELCRQLYCGTQFTLVNSKCIQKPMDSADRNVTNSALFRVRSANYSRITVVMNISLDRSSQIQMDDLKESLLTSFVVHYNISQDRIKNLHVYILWDPEQVQKYLESSDNVLIVEEGDYALEDADIPDPANTTGSPATVITHFDLYEPIKDDVEPSISAILESLAGSFSLNSILLKELNATAAVSSVLSKPLVLEDWCGEQDGGIWREYWNDEFVFLPRTENGTSIGKVYINKTGRTFRTGDFVANVLIRVTGDQKSPVTNRIVIVCDRGTGLPKSCPRVDFNLTQVEIFENNTLVLYAGQGSLSVPCRHYQLMPYGRVRLCLDELQQGLRVRGQLFDGPLMALISLVLSAISIACLALVLTTYSLFSELRNLPGWNIIFLTGSLFVMQLSFLLSQRQSVQGMTCRAAAIVCHYTVVISFFWMNVLAYDLYKTFRTSGSAMGGTRKVSRHLPLYMLYAFGTPLVIVGTCLGLDYFDTPLSPSYGLFGVCWIVNKLSALTFFAVPVAVLLLLNFVFYVMTVYSVHSVARQKPGTVLRRHSSKCPATATTYVRMATGMGLTWVFGFVAAFVRSSENARTAFTYLFIVCNTLQGLFLFYAFVCNRKTYHLYRALFCNVRRGARAKLSTSSSVSSVSTVTSQASLASSVRSTLSNSARAASP